MQKLQSEVAAAFGCKIDNQKPLQCLGASSAPKVQLET